MRQYVLTVEAVAVLLLASALLLAHRPLQGLPAATALTLCACLHMEASRYAARSRTGHNRATQDLMSTWLFALVLLVAPPLAGAAPVLIDLYGWLRVQREEPVKQLFSTATTSTAAVVAGGAFLLLHGGPLLAASSASRTLLAVSMAGAVFAAVNTGLVTGVVLLANPELAVKDAFDGEPLLIEGVTLALAAVVAGCWVAVVVLVPLMLPALLLLQRSLIHRQLLHEARTDAKTGLLHALAWRRVAEVELDRRGGSGRSSPYCSWTSTTSRPSTTGMATSLVTGCSSPWPAACRAPSATRTRWDGSVARSSPSCCRARTRPRRPAWPSGCGARSQGCGSRPTTLTSL